MYSKLHNRLGTAGLAVAVVALVAAVAGTALAAGGLTSQQEKQVTKIAKKYAGKKGAPGAKGDAGAQGPKGDPGSNGSAGTAGAAGATGATGVGGSTGATGATGKNGTAGTEGVAGPTGATGDAGPEGNIKETLPAGTPLKGTWSAGSFMATAGGEIVPAEISFNIPTGAGNPSAFYMKEGEAESPAIEIPPTPTFHQCTGGGASPTVGSTTSGTTVFCIFTAKAVNWKLTRNETTFGVANAQNGSANKKLGGVLLGESEGAGASYAYGTWIVKVVP